MAPRSHRTDAGFTLIEILVVLLILGILAALALAAFIGKSETAKDAEARALARTLQTHVESCYVDTRDWRECDSATDVTKTQMRWGTDPGEVEVLIRPHGREVVGFAATSQTRTTFTILRGIDDPEISRVCRAPSGSYPAGACKPGGPLESLGFGTW